MPTIQRDDLIEAIQQLVGVPSINPDLVPGASGERELAETIAARLRRTPGIDVELQDAGNGRLNVIASVGNGGGRTLLLNGHIDTVGVAGMAEPFAARVEGTRLYGRGASDMKAAMAGALTLLEAIARARDLPGRLIVTFVVDEEYASIGTQAICREIGRWAPDAAIVMEGTGLDIDVAHKGFAWATIVTRGFAAHGSAWEVGVDAIAHMGRVLAALEEHGRELLARAPHPIVGPPSIHASLIAGGQELSSYPDECRLEVERRAIPGETAEQIRVELQALLDRLAADDPRFAATLSMGLWRGPFTVDPEAEIVRALDAIVRDERGAAPAIGGSGGWMDSALLASVGVPTTIFGPGGEGAHGLVEWVELDSVEIFTRVLARFAYDFCARA